MHYRINPATAPMTTRHVEFSRIQPTLRNDWPQQSQPFHQRDRAKPIRARRGPQEACNLLLHLQQKIAGDKPEHGTPRGGSSFAALGQEGAGVQTI